MICPLETLSCFKRPMVMESGGWDTYEISDGAYFMYASHEFSSLFIMNMSRCANASHEYPPRLRAGVVQEFNHSSLSGPRVLFSFFFWFP
jgi:hypothetical protein